MIPGRAHALLPFLPFLLASVLTIVVLAQEAVAQTCPALSLLASSCRNDLCEAALGEDVNSCPEDCADPSSQLMAYYTQAITCPPTTIYEPESIQDLQDVVRGIVSSGRKLKPAGTSHSATDVICADDLGDIVRTKKLKDIGPVEPFEGHPITIEFESGVHFNELQEHLHGEGFSFGLASTGYGGISLGGAVATGAHGSSLLGHSTISSYIVAMDVVGPDGGLTTYSEGTTGDTNPEQWRALRTNLGLLGVVVRLRLRLEPQFNMNVQVLYQNEATFIADDGVAATVADCDYVFLTWFPGQNLVQYLCGNRDDVTAVQPNAQNRLFTPDISDLEEAFALPILQLGMCAPATECFTEQQRVAIYQSQPPLVVTDGPGVNANVVSRHTDLTGYSHRMITLQPEVFLEQPSLSQLEYEGAMPMSQIQSAVQYLHSIYDRENICQPLIGTIMRFDVADEGTLLAGNHARGAVAHGEQMVHLEFVEYWGYELDEAGLDAFVSNPFTEIIEHLVTNYDYWPHWGKNDEWVFEHPSVLSKNASERAVFNDVIATMDPYGVFSNASSRRNGFASPLEGGDFASHYYGACASQDSDGDGVSDCTDRTPNDFSGMYVRIDDDGVWSGTCSKADTWSEMKNNFGADQKQNMAAGWDYDSENHSYHAYTFPWSPDWPNSGGSSWEAMMSARFVPEDSGRYCFSQDNGATGTGIISGWNACSQIWVNKSRVVEVGYSSSNTPVGCVDLVGGQEMRLDLYNRHHNANLSRSFKSKPRWCYGGASNCAPDRKFEQNQLQAQKGKSWP